MDRGGVRRSRTGSSLSSGECALPALGAARTTGPTPSIAGSSSDASPSDLLHGPAQLRGILAGRSHLLDHTFEDRNGTLLAELDQLIERDPDNRHCEEGVGLVGAGGRVFQQRQQVTANRLRVGGRPPRLAPRTDLIVARL